MFDYMGTAYNFVAYLNQMRFVEEEFDQDKRIKKNSVLASYFSPIKEPVWTEAWVEFN